MKTIATMFLIVLFLSSANAGQVYNLQPGQTLPLSDGSIVACMGQSSNLVTVNCDCINGSKIIGDVTVQSYDRTSALNKAVRACRERFNNPNLVVSDSPALCRNR